MATEVTIGPDTFDVVICTTCGAGSLVPMGEDTCPSCGSSGALMDPPPLYFHRTDGGAEYLCDAYIECPNGHREGVFDGARIIVRLDGAPTVTVRD